LQTIDDVVENDIITVTLKDGSFEASVQKITKEEGLK
jgi:hypothetical protein